MRKIFLRIIFLFFLVSGLLLPSEAFASYTLNVGVPGSSINVDFGNVTATIEKSYQVIYLQNTGSDNFSISNIPETEESPFYIQDLIHINSQGNSARIAFDPDTGQITQNDNPVLIQPGEQLEIIVGFPEQYVETGNYSTSFELITTNSTETFATINCSATVVSGDASLSTPVFIDFGNFTVGDINQESFFIVNNGTTALTITGFNISELTEKGVSISTIYQDSATNFVDINAPITMEPGDKLTVNLQYSPVSSGTVVIPFEIFTNSLDLPKQVVLLNAEVKDLASGTLDNGTITTDNGTINGTVTNTTTDNNTTNETVTTENIPESGGSCSISPSGTIGFDLLLPFVTVGLIYFRRKESR